MCCYCMNTNRIIIEMIPPRTTSIYQPLDICVNKRLKSFLRRNSEIYKLKQLHTDSNSIIIKAPDRASIIKDLVKFCKEDRTVVNRWRRIGLFDESIQPKRLSDIDYDGYFISAIDYKLPRVGNTKEINIKDTIEEVVEDSESKDYQKMCLKIIIFMILISQ